VTATVRVLDRLSRVKQTGPARWIASCPTGAHPYGDRSRGLSIREADDRVLICCHAGCGGADIVEALGLTLGDLYDRPLGVAGFEVSHSAIPARDLLEILDHEIVVAVLVLNDIVQRRKVNESQVERLVQAAARIGKARDMANPAKGSRRAA
jgi:hypothetical protein